MQDHPYAEIFPLLSEGELNELAEDIKANGQLEDITAHEGMILDGRNRYRACLLAGVEPLFRGFLGDDPLRFVLSKNLKRRHLDVGQRAMCAAKAATLGKGRPPANGDGKPKPLTGAEAAEEFNVSQNAVSQARKVKENGVPELVAAVQTGEVSLNAALAVAELPPEEQEQVLEEGAEKVREVSRKRNARKKPKSKPEPVKQDSSVPVGQNTSEQQTANTGDEGDMDEIEKLLKRIRQIVKKKPELAKDAAVSLHEMGEEVILYQPELQYGEQRPIYESTYFRVKQGQYEGPTVQRIEGKGDLAIDTYGRPVPMSLRDEFCESRYQKLGAHLERAVSELHSADEIYAELSARAMGVQWLPAQEWNKTITKGAKIIGDGLAAWMNDAVPYAVCRFCNGSMKDAEGNRCKKCKFSGFWPRSEALAHPTMIENKRPVTPPKGLA